MTGVTVDLTLAEQELLDEWEHGQPELALAARPLRRPPVSLRELLLNPALLAVPPAVIPNLAWAGRVTLLSALPKAGKSTLAGQAVAALSVGGDFLGATLTSVSSLVYSLDEALGDTVRRLKAFGADENNVAISDAPPTPAQMYDEIRSVGARFVVLDTLSEVLGNLQRNDASAVAPFLRAYVKVARDTGAALCLNHHTRKDGDSYAGSVAFAAAVDVPLILTPRRHNTDSSGDTTEVDDGMRTLHGKGRGVDVTVRLAFDGERYSAGVAPMPLPGRIRLLLEREPLSTQRLVASLGVRKETVIGALKVLEAEGAISAEGTLNSPLRTWQLAGTTSGMSSHV